MHILAFSLFPFRIRSTTFTMDFLSFSSYLAFISTQVRILLTIVDCLLCLSSLLVIFIGVDAFLSDPIDVLGLLTASLWFSFVFFFLDSEHLFIVLVVCSVMIWTIQVIPTASQLTPNQNGQFAITTSASSKIVLILGSFVFFRSSLLSYFVTFIRSRFDVVSNSS